jgi:hypothetical protein
LVFESSRPFAFFDYFRVPYTVRDQASTPPGLQRLRPGGARRSLLWPSRAGQSARYRLGEATFFGHVVHDADVPGMLRHAGDGWRPAEQITDDSGQPRAAVWRDGTGSVFLPFDPGEVMRQFWSESYRDVGRSPVASAAHTAMLRGYYLMRPALPRPVQLRLRRAFTRVQDRSSFPRWPLEESLHTLYAWLFGVLADLAGQPVPFLSPWPDGRSWALVLTHDVETAAGYRTMELLRAPERELGYRSSWNFVPLRYRVPDETVRALWREGCEVGVHGLRHDGRDLGSRRLMEKRLPAIREYAERWQAVGFRSPATQRRWELMPRLGFGYDSSYSDTDPYEPQPGGCCTYLPYFNDGMVELPITLPQDHTMFSILGQPDADLWLHKAKQLRDRHGMVLLLAHPDYAGDPRLAEGYRTLLETFAGDDTVWHALPKEVAAWWRRRSASTIAGDDGRWAIVGPAASDGRVELAGGDPR